MRQTPHRQRERERERIGKKLWKGSDYDVCSCSMNRPPALSSLLAGILFSFSSGPLFPVRSLVLYLKGLSKMRNVTLSLIDKGSSYRQRNTQKNLEESEENPREEGAKKKKRWWSKQTSLIILAQLCAISAATSSYYSLLKGVVIITQAQPWITITKSGPRLDEDVGCHRDLAFLM